MQHIIAQIVRSACKQVLGFSTVRFHFATSSPTAAYFSESRILLHALQTPVTVLKCTLEQVAEHRNADLAKNLAQSRSAILAIEKILQFDQWSEESGASFQLAPLLHEVTTLFSDFSGAQISLIMKDSRAKVAGARLLLSEVISCLIKNAVESYPRQTDNKPVVIFCEQEQQMIRLEIIDFGTGMNAISKYLATKNGITFKLNGRGIGLAFVSEVVTKVFQGTVCLSSQLHMGTRVVVKIPCFKAPSDTQCLAHTE